MASTPLTDDIKKKINKMTPNITEKIGEYVDDVLDEEVFKNVEFDGVSWSDKIRIVNIILEKIREVI